jgi:hypothetical protein
MARTCTVCRHPDRPAIDQALINHRPFRSIAVQFSTSKSALIRHYDDHLPEALTKARAAEETAHADNLLDQVRGLRQRAGTILDTAERAGDLRAALGAIRETRACLELLLEVEGELDRRPQMNVLLSPEWVQVRTVLLVALRPYPEARRSVAECLASLESSG